MNNKIKLDNYIVLFRYLGSSSSSTSMGPGGAPNRPLPPTPDEEESGDRTLVLRRVSVKIVIIVFRLMHNLLHLSQIW